MNNSITIIIDNIYIYETLYFDISSEIICTIKLDPFYQAFLRARFEQSTGQPFRFSKGHDLSLFFQAMLRPLPFRFERPDFGENAFPIEIPFMEHKNPLVYCYISPERNIMIASRVMRYWKMISHDVITQARRLRMEKKEVFFFLLEELNIPVQYSDRVEREYSRYLQDERQRRFLTKARMLKKAKKIKDKTMK